MGHASRNGTNARCQDWPPQCRRQLRLGSVTDGSDLYFAVEDNGVPYRGWLYHYAPNTDQWTLSMTEQDWQIQGQDWAIAGLGVDSNGNLGVAGSYVDADPGFVEGDWGFAYDASAGVGVFARIESVAGVGPYTLTLLDPLTFTPDDAADVWHATIVNYIDNGAADRGNHQSRRLLQAGQTLADELAAVEEMEQRIVALLEGAPDGKTPNQAE